MLFTAGQPHVEEGGDATTGRGIMSTIRSTFFNHTTDGTDDRSGEESCVDCHTSNTAQETSDELIRRPELVHTKKRYSGPDSDLKLC
jgi:hypothetical protein